MKGKGLLVALLLAVGLCFVPALGYGEVKEWMDEFKPSVIEFHLLQAKVDYIMQNPTNFLIVRFDYDRSGVVEKAAESGKEIGFGKLPKGVDTKGKTLVMVFDSRGVFSHKSQTALLGQFESELESIRSSSLDVWIELEWRQKQDVVAKFISKEGNPLGYFYQGEYHLWGE